MRRNSFCGKEFGAQDSSARFGAGDFVSEGIAKGQNFAAIKKALETEQRSASKAKMRRLCRQCILKGLPNHELERLARVLESLGVGNNHDIQNCSRIISSST